MAEVKMRFRTDGWHYADMKAKGTDYLPYCQTDEQKKYWNETPVAEPGDVWRIHWSAYDEAIQQNIDGPLAGYAICCLKCKGVHAWTTANNCNQPIERSYINEKSEEVKYQSCVHNGVGSCWNWTGSAEDNQLSGTPSLLVTDGVCGFHGFLTNGILKEC